MKRWVFLFAVFAALMVAFAGCSGGDDGSPYGTPDSGAGSDSGVDGNPGYGIVDSGGDHDASKDAGVTDDGSVTDGGEFDAGFDAGPPDAGPPFAITAAASTSDTTVTITYNEPPNATEATTKTSYAISGGLTVSGATIVGNVVTLTTSVQSSTSYMVTVSGVTRASDASALITDTANFTGRNAFDVSSAASGGSTTVSVTFDAPPDMTTATTASNYAISGLTISAAALSGNVVTLTTSTQSATTYSLAVSNVTRASDGEALSTNHATFTGHTTFNVTSASATSATTVDVTFDAAPNSTSAVVATNYAISGLTISGASLTGNVVTLTTSAQTATSLTVTVSNVTRASDGEPLTTNTANFTGIAPFDISSAAAPTLTKVTVTYDATPDSASALTATNYSIPGLVVNAVSLSGSVATLTTTTQTTTTYTLTVFNVTRASDGQPLTNNTATFSQTVPGVPTVTNVVVASTSPNNGTTPYNTGTSTLTITGTGFSSITTCASAVKLDDLDGAGNAVGTSPTSCTVDSGTQITAIFPSGIRTNGTTGWNVKVTNTTGTNTTSSVTFVPVAGLVISEIYTGTSGNSTHEFLSIYNPTSASIDIGTLGLVLHIRNGTPTDSVKTLTKVTTNAIASHGFMLFASSASNNGDTWYSHRDSTYSSSSGNTLVSGGGVYISLSGTAQANVIDKVGWGSQAAGGYEGTATPDISSNDSIQRKFTGAVPTDTDVNSSDFNAQSTTLAHKGTGDTGL